MPIIALDDILAFLTFGLVIGFADAYYSGTQASLIEPFVEVFLSIGLGLAVGLASYYILRGIHNKSALAIGTTLLLMTTLVLSLVLHAEMLIAGITWGVVVFNLLNESQQKRFSHANERLVQVSVVVLMVLIGTTLDLKAVLSFTVIVGATVYVLARGVGKVGGSAIGAKLANAEPTVQKYLGVTLLAAAGITLTFVAIASSVLPESSATRMATTIAAAALINEVIAVVATKWAFKQAGELGKLDEVVV
jgi:NhaP-type Na+/H+ or K+/H+ antiporter